jgi:hypothetical protein
MMIGIGLVSTVSHTLYRPHWYLLAGMVAANRRIVSTVLHKGATSSVEPAEEDFNVNAVYGSLSANPKLMAK